MRAFVFTVGVDMKKLLAAAQYIDGVLGRRTNSRVGAALSAKAAKQAAKEASVNANAPGASTSN
jgi:hypothetical protein